MECSGPQDLARPQQSTQLCSLAPSGTTSESHLTRQLFAAMLRKITMLPAPAG